MDPATIAMLGALFGGVVGKFTGDEKEKMTEDLGKYAAAQTRWSPWTHIAPEKVNKSSKTGSILSGALAGGQMGMNYNQWNQMDNNNDMMRQVYAKQFGVDYDPNS